MAKKSFSLIVFLLIILLVGAYFANYISLDDFNTDFITKKSDPIAEIQNNPRLLSAYQNHISKLQIEGQGMIIQVLKDDLEGSRHQRLLVRVNKEQTLLIVHNIDMAPRIPDPQVGQTIHFYGEYRWNNKGGIIHWTHKDPAGKHQGGWLIYKHNKYE